MSIQLKVLFVIGMITMAAALPVDSEHREKRDVMESVKNAWDGVTKTISDAGDAVVHVFKPTEKSTIDKVADSIKNISK